MYLNTKLVLLESVDGFYKDIIDNRIADFFYNSLFIEQNESSYESYSLEDAIPWYMYSENVYHKIELSRREFIFIKRYKDDICRYMMNVYNIDDRYQLDDRDPIERDQRYIQHVGKSAFYIVFFSGKETIKLHSYDYGGLYCHATECVESYSYRLN